MSIEDLMIAHTAALIANTDALNAFTACPRADFSSSNEPTINPEEDTAEKPAATKAATKTAVKKVVKKVAKKATPTAEEPGEELIRLNTRLKILHKSKGAAVVKKLLAEFKVAKLGELSADEYGNFNLRMTDLRGGKAAEVEEPAAEGEMTYDKVRDIVLEVSNHDMLGKEIARGFIQDAGADKLPDLTKDQYQEVYDACVAQLNKVEAV